jgi:membrane protease YdiL (CAAX protease family)
MALPATQGHVRWREVALFSLIAYGLTWGWHAIWIGPHIDSLLARSTTPSDATVVYGNHLNALPGMFGPLLAAVAMRLWVSREGIGGSLGLRQAWQTYAMAVAAPTALIAVVALMLLVTDLAHPAPSGQAFTFAFVGILAVLLVPESFVGFGEEYGWRGYLLPRLMPLGETPATLVIGVIWALWHLPVLISGVLLGGFSLWLIVPIHLCVVVVSSFPYTWLARATEYSPALAAIFHGSTNWSQQRLMEFLVIGNLLAGVAAIGVGWLIVVLAFYGFRLFRPWSRTVDG